MTRWTEFDDPAFLERLRDGDQSAYRVLIRRFHRSLIHMATPVIGSAAQAEEVAQDTWLAFFSGIGRFEGRSSVVTWLFSILLNRARTRASREKRLVSLPAGFDGLGGEERAVPLSAFKPDGHWVETPRLWDDISPERVIGGRQLWDHVMDVITTLPAGQRAVVVMRDIEGQSAEDTCAMLDISPENQRVLLHRARGRVRQVIDTLTQTGDAQPLAARQTAGRKARSTSARIAGWSADADLAASWGLAATADGAVLGLSPRRSKASRWLRRVAWISRALVIVAGLDPLPRSPAVDARVLNRVSATTTVCCIAA